MTEKEYRISIFSEKFEKYRDKKIALYGTGENSRAILAEYPEFPIAGIWDDKAAGTYKYGKLVLSSAQVLELGIEVVIIAAQMSSAQLVYARILDLCLAHKIQILDMYGNDAFQVSREITRQEASYYDRHKEQLREAVAEHDVISFEVMDTLLIRTLPDRDALYDLIDEMAREDGIVVEGFKERRRKAELEAGRVHGGLPEIYDLIQKETGISGDWKERLIELDIAAEKKTLIVREDVFEAYRLARESGKKTALLFDSRLPYKELQSLLEAAGIDGFECLLTETRYECDKKNGLYRELLPLIGEGDSWLHVGTDSVEDGYAPSMYGADIFLLKSGMDMLQKLSDHPINLEQNRSAYNQFVVGSFVSREFNSPFALYHTGGCLGHSLVGKLMRFRYNEGILDHSMSYRPVLFEVPDKVKKSDQVKPLKFKVRKRPMVSIIIPVYNQFEYTYCCLRSILEYSNECSYEIIIADDHSTDLVKDIEKVVSGITVIHNRRNLRFLLNCNYAAQQARGKYILFLNNDTQVQPGWLDALVRLMESDERIGMTGSKLVYPDGYLQEAGGILWEDGSAWNFGNRKDPEAAEYNYVKEADYISGAAIMIRTRLWKKIGGFDEQFVPAYYEDTDLAFEVRRAGYKVVYQPASVVVHFEGVSNGTDLHTGIKAYQMENAKKFYAKWKDVLAKECFKNGENVFIAKDRSRFKKRVLVVDHYVPNHDKDAGGKCTYMYLKTLVRMGAHVTFMGDNFARLQPYTDELNQMGIEVLYGNNYFLNWEYWLSRNLKYFDYVYLQRPHISIKYIDIIKRFSKAKVIYFAHDLHHVREYRRYLLERSEEALKLSEYWKKIEYELFSKADVGHVVGDYEQRVLQKDFDKPIRNIPLYVYEELPGDINKDFSTRHDILYVGGFGHPPNEDAVIWFAKEIFPRILEKYPDMKWHVVGSKPTETILGLADDHIIIEGYKSDEELDKLYRECRIAVVPLRYGAGVKGKVIEGAYYQIPLVTTPIGAEGIPYEDGIFAIEEKASKMAEKICCLYEDFDELHRMSDRERELIRRDYMVETAERILSLDMEI